jgi:hypothetical protein
MLWIGRGEGDLTAPCHRSYAVINSELYESKTSRALTQSLDVLSFVTRL